MSNYIEKLDNLFVDKYISILDQLILGNSNINLLPVVEFIMFKRVTKDLNKMPDTFFAYFSRNLKR